MQTITITTLAGREYQFNPVPMKTMPSEVPEQWLTFLRRHVPGTSLSDREMERMQHFMRFHKTEALTDGEQNYTLAGGMLALCDPAAL